MSEAPRHPPVGVMGGMWLHQLAEYVLGFSMVVAGAQRPSPVPLAVAGGLVVLNAAVVVAPLSPFRWVGASLHRALDSAVVVALIVIAIVSDDSTTRAMLVVYGGLLVALMWVFRPRKDGVDRR